MNKKAVARQELQEQADKENQGKSEEEKIRISEIQVLQELAKKETRGINIYRNCV